MVDRQQGFSLIETLVAMALLGLVTGVVYSSYSNSMRGAEESARTAVATRFAQSKLEAVSAGGLVDLGEQRGSTEDGFSWRVVVGPLEDQDSAPVETQQQFGGNASQAALVTVTVSWQGRQRDRSVALTTVRLAKRGDGG